MYLNKKELQAGRHRVRERLTLCSTETEGRLPFIAKVPAQVLNEVCFM